jgi:hypothetical protein
MYPTAEGLAGRLRILRRRACAPFASKATRTEAASSPWLRRLAIRAPEGSVERVAYDEQVVTLHGEAAIDYALPAESRGVVASYGMLPNAWRLEHAHSAGMRFDVVLAGADGKETVLFETTLRPASDAKDRGLHKLELDLPPGASGKLTLRTHPVADGAGGDPAYDWGFWTDVVLR